MGTEGKNTLDGQRADLDFRAAMAMGQADEVVQWDGGDISCLCCRRRVHLSRIVMFQMVRPALCDVAGGQRLMAGICADCVSAGSEDRAAAVAELVRAAAQVDSLLSLIRHRAEAPLASWWGAVGACSTFEVDRASVELRRSIERLGVRP